MKDRILYYTGVGSRDTPKEIGVIISKISSFLERKGFILRTGDAIGADFFFRKGIKNKEVYIAKDSTKEAEEMASLIHPAWNNCNEYARKLHGRNCFQVLGRDFKSPSEFIVCWTKNGKISGGTATAINLALKNNIPVFNLGKDTDETLKTFKLFLAEHYLK